MSYSGVRPEVVRALQTLSSPSVANAIETFDVRPRSTGYMTSEIRCALPDLGVMVGYAATAKIRTTLKPEPGAAIDRRVMWDHILSLPEPRVVVIQDLDERPLGSFWGEVNANIHRALGCVGTVTNGGVRDLDEVEALGFHLFASHIHVSHAYVHVVEVGTPVEFGGLAVQPGDLLHGDKHGIINIPLDIADRVYQAAKDVDDRERKIIDLCKSPDFSVDKLWALYH